jgi:RecA-family ATPase
MTPHVSAHRDIESWNQPERLRLFAGEYIRTGNAFQAIRRARLQNPQYRMAVWAERLFARDDVQAMIAEAGADSSFEPAPETADTEFARPKHDAASLHAIAVGSLAGTEPPERAWIVPHWLPSRATTLLSGEGGTGKSLMVQQWLSCLSQGLPFMGIRGVEPARCLYLNCEDETGELHRRQAAAALAIGRQMETFGNDMLLVPRLGAPDNALGTFDGVTGQFKPTPLYLAIRDYCIANGVRVVALDNVAHLYSGNENIRGDVTAFLNALSRLALEIDGAVILIGHPAKADGSQYSGSTAWENAVRNRLYLRRPNDDDGRTVENRRILTRSKSNVASIGDEIEMIWHEGAFHPPSVVEAAVGRDGEVEAIFESCLKAASVQRRNVSHATGSNYAPKLFATMSESRGVGKKALAAAMERLFSKGRIVANQPLWFNEGSRRQVYGIAFAAT